MKRTFLQSNSRRDGLPTGIIAKQFEAKALDLAEDGTLTVNASMMGRMDRGGDCIFPDAFDGTFEDFITNGFNPIGHDWGSLPVAFPISIEQKGNLLVSTAKFHSTDRGQEARTVCKERMDAGKSVGVSVGFMPDYATGVVSFRNGTELLAWAKSKGYDMSLFDFDGITAWQGKCRAITKVLELFEWSICCVGMNPGATATEAKSLGISGAVLQGYYNSNGDYVTDTAADATLAALREYDYALYRTVARTLYDTEATTEAKVETLDTAYATHGEKCVKIIEALLVALADASEEEQATALMALQAFRMPGLMTLAAGKESEVGSTGEPAPVEPTTPGTDTLEAGIRLKLLRLETEIALLED